MRLLFLLIFLLSGYSGFSQNYLDSLKSLKSVCFLGTSTFDSLKIKEIKIYTFLTKEELKRIPSNKEVSSKVLVYKYDPPGRIKEVIKNYSGLDSTGLNKLKNNNKEEELLIHGMVYYYNGDGKISSTLSYGAGVNPNSGYIYDHEGKLVMIRYYFDKVMHKYSESAGRTILDYYPQNGKVKYRIKLDNKGAVEKSEFFIYDNYWNLKGIASSAEAGSALMPYKPYMELGGIAPWQIMINNIPVNNFLFNINRKSCTSVLMEVAPDEYYFFKF